MQENFLSKSGWIVSSGNSTRFCLQIISLILIIYNPYGYNKYTYIYFSTNNTKISSYNKCISALDFHHLNPQEKFYSIASNGTCRDLETDIAEIRNCILVCANCHREIHSNMYSLEQLKSL